MAVTSCAEIRELFSARADETLTAEERAQLDAHLATCADCTREWRRFEQTLALVRSIEPARAPAGFVDRVRAARPRPWYRRLARAVLLPWSVKLPLEAAAILVVAGLAVLLMQRSPELQRAAREPATPQPSVFSQTPVPTPPAVATAPPATPAPAESRVTRAGPASPAPSSPSSAPDAPGAAREQELRQRTFDSLDAQRRSDLRDAAPSTAAPDRTPDAAGNAAPSPPVTVPSDVASSSGAAPAPAPDASASGAIAQPRAGERAKTDTLAKERAETLARPSAGPPPAPQSTPQEAKKDEKLAGAGTSGGETDRTGAAAGPPATLAPTPLSAGSLPLPGEIVLANPPSVRARLTMSDRDAGVRAVREIVASVKGQIVVLAENSETSLMELSVPAPGWEDVKTRLQALGPLQVETAGDASGDPLRILLRLQR